MKKAMALVLSLMLLLGSTAALAEDSISVDITFEGEWFTFEGYNFQLYLPLEWGTYTGGDDYEFYVGNEDGTEQLMIDVIDADGYTIEDMLLDFSNSEGYENVEGYNINGIPFVLFELPAESMMGALTMLKDEDSALMFVYYSEDAEFGELATQIMASIQVAE